MVWQSCSWSRTPDRQGQTEGLQGSEKRTEIPTPCPDKHLWGYQPNLGPPPASVTSSLCGTEKGALLSEPVPPSVKWASVQLSAFTRNILRTEVCEALGSANKWLWLFYYSYC